MIYDCFTFFNELDLLEIRLQELDDVVDRFVLVEAQQTFSGNNKALFFNENKARYKKYLSKIIHVIVKNFSQAEDIRNTKYFKKAHFLKDNFKVWSNEVFQRNAIMQGLINANNNDIILIGDIDELPNKHKFKELHKKFNNIKGFEQDCYYYYLNCKSSEKIIGTKAIIKKNLITPQDIRMNENYQIITNGGWHFTYLGGIENIQKKIKSFSHQEFNNKTFNSYQHLKFNIDNYLDIFERPFKYSLVSSTSTLPESINKNLKKIKKYFKKETFINNNQKKLIEEIIKLRQKLTDTETKFQIDISNLKYEVSEYKIKIEFLKNELNEIYHSSFWKLHQPYVQFKSILKKIKLK